MSKPLTVAQLAKKADVDLDETLVTLWDVGISHVTGPEDVIPPKSVKIAERALEIENPKEQTRIDYWIEKTGLSRKEFVERVSQLGVHIQPKMRKLPKGGLRKVKRLFLHGEHTQAPSTKDADSADGEVAELPVHVWEDIGNRRAIVYLSEEEVLHIHDALVADFVNSEDPISPPGLRDINLFSSDVARPQTALGDEFKYPTVEMAAAALMHSVILNHCFNNGNKRTGLVSMLAFLDKNSMIATCSEDELFRFTLQVAQHRLVPPHYDQLADREVAEIAYWIKSHSRRVTKGERPIPWRRLRRILNGFDCELTPAPGKGNRIDIRRRIEESGLLGRKKAKFLSTQVAWAGDGTTVERNTLNYIRSELRLNEENGIDSKVFYEAEAEPDDFIQAYRTVLRRLGRL